MTPNGEKNRDQIEFTSLEDLVPEGHLIRKMENAIDWSFIYEMVEGSYCEDNGRPSLDPVILLKLPLLHYYTQRFGKAQMEVKAAPDFTCINLKKLAKKR